MPKNNAPPPPADGSSAPVVYAYTYVAVGGSKSKRTRRGYSNRRVVTTFHVFSPAPSSYVKLHGTSGQSDEPHKSVVTQCVTRKYSYA